MCYTFGDFGLPSYILNMVKKLYRWIVSLLYYKYVVLSIIVGTDAVDCTLVVVLCNGRW
jgi:hypothetical protein